MNSKRKTMLVAAFVVAVVALAGVGYATVTGYKATTTVTANTVGDSQYITIYPGDGAVATDYTTKITGAFAFDTTNAAGTVTYDDVYTITNDAITAAGFRFANIDSNVFSEVTAEADQPSATYKFVSVGNIVINVNTVHSENKLVQLTTTVNTDAYTAGSDSNVKLILTYKVGSSGNETVFTPGNAATIKYNAINNNAIVPVTFSAYLIVLQAGSALGSVNSGSNGELVDATFTFTAQTIASLN